MTTITTILHEAEERMKKALTTVQHQLAEVRGGRASPAMIEHLRIECYGTAMPLKQVASITAPEARLLMVQPWDQSTIPDIEKALLKSGLGLTPAVDGKIMRLPIPQMTKERREELDRLVRKLAEDGRISIRNVRRDGKETVEQLKKAKTAAEDEAFKAQDHLQKLTDAYIAKVDALLKQKEQELVTV